MAKLKEVLKMDIKNILVPIDFSSSSHRIFELGHCLAEHVGATIHLIHVMESSFSNDSKSPVSEAKFIHKLRIKNAKEELIKFKFEVPHSDIDIIVHLAEGSVHKEILLYAEQNNIDMIIIASHGWTNLPNMIMGKVANKIMRQANMPVICIKSNLPVIRNRGERLQRIGENLVG